MNVKVTEESDFDARETTAWRWGFICGVLCAWMAAILVILIYVIVKGSENGS